MNNDNILYDVIESIVFFLFLAAYFRL